MEQLTPVGKIAFACGAHFGTFRQMASSPPNESMSVYPPDFHPESSLSLPGGAAQPPPVSLFNSPGSGATGKTGSSSLVLASPHSGRYYPPDLLAQAKIDLFALRRSEDMFVDELIQPLVAAGQCAIMTNYARSYVDLNRSADEIDPQLTRGSEGHDGHGVTERVRAGLGVVPRLAGQGMDIYRGRLPLAAMQQRVKQVHIPYHRQLSDVLDGVRARHGHYLLVDCHSMPSAALPVGLVGMSRPDVVLGDLFGTACAPELATGFATILRKAGLKVAINKPYAGGYTTEAYGRPALGGHALQLEICRSLYMDETRLVKTPRFAAFRQQLCDALAELAQLADAHQTAMPFATAAE